jgi:ribosomal protein L7/L12
MGVDRQLLEIKQRVALIETRLQQLFDHLDIAPRESAEVGQGGDAINDPEIQDLLVKGNEAQAVKRYRELTGVGIAEAQKAIQEAQGPSR